MKSLCDLLTESHGIAVTRIYGRKPLSHQRDALAFVHGIDIAIQSLLYIRDSILLGVERSDGYHEYEISTVKDEETGRKVIGITYNQSARKRFGFFEAIKLSFKWLWLIVKEMFQALHGAIFGGDGISNLSGPVGTIAIIGESVRYGFEVILRLLALLSLNLGIINLLPFPALDGGRIVLLGVEKLIGRPLNRKVEGIINLAGLVLLLILMVCLTYQDITRLL